YEQERDELVRAVETAARLGIDGVMVQDLGVAAIMRQCAPGLPIFGSTQMAVHNLAGVREAARLGCRRVVLARELSREEIRRITAESPIEIEMFVHGALCMSVSGQCYLSSMLGGRSGNRGLCAQPCRLPFAAGQSVGALSLKDLTLADRFAELRELGVASLKIEGRMKRPEYVAAAVTALVDAREGRAPDLDRLRSVFSRSGFTSGYFDGKLDASMFGLRQKEDVVAAAGVLGELERLATQEKPRVGLEGVLTAQAGEPISLALRDRDGHSVYCEGETPQAARTKPTDEERARASLLKTGGTPYFFDDLSIELGDGLMLPVSQLNALRRDALDRMTALRAALQGTPFSDRAKRQHLKTLN
ncbi:MAG: U32 family peptidase, partial [Oscillospiraceae bacterium]